MTRLYWKIFGFLLLAQLTAILTISAGFWIHQHNRALNSEGVEISPPARTMIQSASATLKHGGKTALRNLLEEWQHRPTPLVLAIDNNGKELLDRDYSPQVFATAKALAQEAATESVNAVNLTGGETITLFVPGSGHSGYEPPHDLGHEPPHDLGHEPPHDLGHDDRQPPPEPPLIQPHKPGRLPFWPIIASVLVSLIFAAIIARYFSKPIQILHSAFDKGARGDLNSDVSQQMHNRADAFSDLGKNFDSMASRLNKLLMGQKRLLNHVSHELRSPLSRIQIAIGLAKQNSEKIPSSLDRIQLESERMDQLIGELLQLSKLESGVSALNKEEVNLSHLLQDMLDDASFEAAEKRVTVKSDLEENCTLNCDAELIYRAVENIVRNAIKYTDPETMIYVTLKRIDSQLRIEVIDQGAGVVESALEEIFHPFVRTNHAQPKHGYGIGLALARQIIEAHAGIIKAENNTGQAGLKIMVSLPAD